MNPPSPQAPPPTAPSVPDRPGTGKRPRDPRVPTWAPWLVGPVLLTAAGVGFVILRSRPMVLFSVAALVAGGVVVLWVLISSLWPARADRNCPGCGGETLERIDPRTTVGVRCRACGFWDDSLSSWFLAEEEGPLEQFVLDQRRRRSQQTPSNLTAEGGFQRERGL